jgi:hypothetical protein
MKTKQGFVYVLSNPSMPNLVKIGVTDNVKERIKNLSQRTAIPTPFEVEYECMVEDCYKVEKALQAAFAPYRVNENREFFKIKTAQVTAILQLIQTENTTEEATADQAEVKRNPRFKFLDMKIPVGADLVFVQDNEIKATVCENNNVTHNGKEWSLSALTRKLIGYIVRPLQYWTYNDKNLLDVYRETYTTTTHTKQQKQRLNNTNE